MASPAVDLSNCVPIGDVLYSIETVSETLFTEDGIEALSGVDFVAKVIKISRSVPLANLPAVVALATLHAIAGEPTVLYCPMHGRGHLAI